MGSSTDGYSAAQGAPEADPDQERSGGILSRFFRKAANLASNDAGGASATQDAGLPGMGNLWRLKVDDVAIPKVEIIAVPDSITREELMAVFREHGLSRIPVYEGSMDQPLGVVTLKDFALRDILGEGGKDFDVKALMRPLIYVPPSMPLTALLKQMQDERTHMALVIDEYGGVDGLVTFEDLLETVVGDILDEHDTVEGPFWSEEGPGVWLIEANADLAAAHDRRGSRNRHSGRSGLSARRSGSGTGRDHRA
jgi:magnesium and cobalt transporter